MNNTCGSRGGEGEGSDPPSLKNHKHKGFLSITGPDPLKNDKATKPDSMLGRHRHANETPFKYRMVNANKNEVALLIHFRGKLYVNVKYS